MATLETLHFDNRQLRELPIDEGPNQVRSVPNAVFAIVEPTPVKNPVLVATSQPALELLGLAPDQTRRPEFAEYFSGNRVLPGARPAAHCYCGHQFGSFAGQLGDGATMYLGELVSGAERWELQFKGAGKTPFSRTADGRKVLRSSIREFLCSELMAGLGIPTTRAGTVVTSDSTVTRDVFYSGDPIRERCTVITRIAPSFLRFGSFEVAKGADPDTGRAGPSAGNGQILDRLLEYVCTHFYGDACAALPTAGARYAAMYVEIARRTASLAAQWQAQGFCHGVLNTDNMSLLGLTLDYGPFGWMDRYDPGFICNASDNGGRYAYENQPAACRWNVLKLGEVLAQSPAIQAAHGAREWDFRSAASAAFTFEFKRVYQDAMRRKLGLGLSRSSSDPADGEGGMGDGDMELVTSLLDTMAATGADYTNTFRALMGVDLLHGAADRGQGAGAGAGVAGGGDGAGAGSSSAGTGDPVLAYLLTQTASAAEMAEAAKPQVPLAQLRRIAAMAQSQPHLGIDLQEVQAEVRKHEQWEAARSRTDGEKAEQDAAAWGAWLGRYRSRVAQEVPPDLRPPPEGTPPGQQASHQHHPELRRLSAARADLMARANPKYVLRNWIAHKAIVAAEAGDFTVVQSVLQRMLDPFGLAEDEAGAREGRELAASHVVAPNTAAEGATHAHGSPTGAPSAKACGMTVDLASRPPPDMRDLKVT